jgi:foldase protein PrsA
MKRIMAGVLTIMMLSFALTGCASKGLTDGSVAKVNGESISRQALETRFRLMALFFGDTAEDGAAIEQLREQMIQEELLLQQAKRLGIVVTDEEIETEMNKFLGALDRQLESRDEVNDRLRAIGLTNDIIAGFLEDFLLTQAVIDRQRAEVTVTEEQALAFYEQFKASLYTFDEPVVRASHVLLPADQEGVAAEVAAKAKEGGDFSALAKLYSVDPNSSRVGGDLGYFTQGTMAREFADEAFRLQVGEVGAPVKTQFGWHVIQVTDKHGKGVVPFEQARPDILNRMLPELEDAAFTQWLSALEQGAKVTRAAVQ